MFYILDFGCNMTLFILYEPNPNSAQDLIISDLIFRGP